MRHFAPLLLCLANLGSAQEAEALLIRFKVTSGAELYFQARCLAQDPELPADHPMFEVVAKMRDIEPLLASPKSWPVIDGAFALVETPGQYAQSMADKFLPPRGHLNVGIKRVKVGNAVHRLAAALDAVSEVWVAKTWPTARQALEARAKQLRELMPLMTQRSMIRSLEETIGIRQGNWAAPVRLVTALPSGQGQTVMERDGTMTCHVSIAGLEGATLVEAAFHEVMYALQVQPFFPPSMHTTMGAKLKQAGLNEALVECTLATLMHVCAAHVVRQYVDPDHTDLAYTSGYRKANESLYDVVGALWQEFCRGDILRPQLVDTLIVVLSAGLEDDGDD